MSSSTMNPFALGSWSNAGVQEPPSLAFKIQNPSGEGRATVAPVDMLNCVVTDPHNQRHLAISTTIPTRGMSINPVTSVQDARGRIVAQAEWPSSGGRHPIVQSNGDIKVPRQASNVLLQATANPSVFSVSIEGQYFTWVNGTHDYKLYSGGNGFQSTELLVAVTKEYTGELSLSVSVAGLEEGALLLSVLILVVVLSPRA